ncbi:ABC transporter substrate-binding protein [Bradyrhizobium sp. BR13661]|jgi:branched-chain amino acid transport system substrate-binding protein|uniref:ABC transporter substrate-binding protein n=1 Tax=Bradyrhizobium sp. BR13661 TaxID=2940622 RepID=UPI0024771C75|nr:ABC transporter substrate-binding protein [Bradyrhizobium sp. BR13661]MDH6261807.1 branched-chain amino acid transport system substrate-binding protein [Bradyrhizobium sp. BR13661]
MNRSISKVAFRIALAVSLVPASVSAATIKVGIIALMSGPYGQYGRAWSDGVKAYQKLNGVQVGADTIEVVFRDLPDSNPAQARSLAQELIIKDKVLYLGGVTFSPDAIAVAQVAEEAKVPFVVIGAASSAILDKSEFVLRSGNTVAQLTVPVAKYAAESNLKRVVTMVADYVTGVDAEAAFAKGLTEAGGQVVERIRVPMKTADFGPFMQTAKSLNPQAVFVFFPGGQPAISAIRSFADNGLKADGIRLLGTTETAEIDLPSIGDAAIGMKTGMWYAPQRGGDVNAAFLKAVREATLESVVSYPTVAAFDAMHIVYSMIKATGDVKNGDKAMQSVKGLSWESPRGPVTIDAKSRDLIQNIYIREVAKDATGALYNREIKTYEAQPDYGRAR